MELLGAPIKLSRTPADPTRPAPALGADTDAVLAEAGFSEDEIAAMRDSGAALGPTESPVPARFMS